MKKKTLDTIKPSYWIPLLSLWQRAAIVVALIPPLFVFLMIQMGAITFPFGSISDDDMVQFFYVSSPYAPPVFGKKTFPFGYLNYPFPLLPNRSCHPRQNICYCFSSWRKIQPAVYSVQAWNCCLTQGKPYFPSMRLAKPHWPFHPPLAK
jgi:hypothetical protein